MDKFRAQAPKYWAREDKAARICVKARQIIAANWDDDIVTERARKAIRKVNAIMDQERYEWQQKIAGDRLTLMGY